jgi:hypothetical protein
MVADGADDAAALQALGRVFQALDRENSQGLLLAISRRPDSPEKVQRFQAVEVLSRRMLAAAQEHHRTVGAEWASMWANVAEAAAKATWQRLGGSAGAFTPADQGGPEVLLDFMDDAELMGILGLEPGWTADLKQADKELDLKSTDKSLDL